ncbi:MAG: ferredoxin [Thermoprotei archaeon]|nr:MAG: ferredoxin [Thermoprotei archaeon]
MTSEVPIDVSREIARVNELLLSKPSPGAAGRTGTWRLMKPVLDSSKCVKCGLCWLYCPDEVIEWSPGTEPRIDYDYCKGCGICASVCPKGAITMVIEGE